jgi:hypothetical protein
MNQKDIPVQVNTGTSVTAVQNKVIYLTNATAGFSANGANINIPTGCLNFSSPFVVTGDITGALAGSLFYYFE